MAQGAMSNITMDPWTEWAAMTDARRLADARHKMKDVAVYLDVNAAAMGPQIGRIMPVMWRMANVWARHLEQVDAPWLETVAVLSAMLQGPEAAQAYTPPTWAANLSVSHSASRMNAADRPDYRTGRGRVYILIQTVQRATLDWTAELARPGRANRIACYYRQPGSACVRLEWNPEEGMTGEISRYSRPASTAMHEEWKPRPKHRRHVWKALEETMEPYAVQAVQLDPPIGPYMIGRHAERYAGRSTVTVAEAARQDAAALPR